MIMKKKENTNLTSTLKEPREAWGAPGAENLSFDNPDVSWSSIYSFTDDMGYQGSQDLTSEEESSVSLSKRRKRSKVAVVRVERNGAKTEGDEDEEDEDCKVERSAPSPRAPRTIQRQYPYSRASPLGHEEHLRILESSLSLSTAEVKMSRWRLAVLCEYLCSCCHRGPEPGEESRTCGAGRGPSEPGSGGGCIGGRRARAQGSSSENSVERSGQKPGEKA
ncbi:uncharacterized protein LOC143678745 [Tamandua tetradactyla]|uniref:uncharacterized protein LOC143678745 n=1 Tax=Tamandua tetradactyla TaxID=48850 RepID=UPI004053DA95